MKINLSPRNPQVGGAIIAGLFALALYKYLEATTTLVLLIAVIAIADPGIAWIARKMRLPHMLTAGLVGVAFFAVVGAGSYFLVPAILHGLEETASNAGTLAVTAPEQAKAWLEWLQKNFGGFLPENTIEDAVEALKKSLGALVAPSAQLATSVLTFLFRSALGVGEIIALVILGFMVLMYWRGPHGEAVGIGAMLRTFYPNQAEAWIEVGLRFQRYGAVLFGAMALVMVGFSVLFTMVLKLVFGMSFGKAVTYGIALGTTGGLPGIGGIINYGLATTFSLMHFGLAFSWLGYMLLMTYVVHKLEMSVVTPWVVGGKLEFTMLGVIACMLAGLCVFGVSFRGILGGLLFLPLFKAIKEVVDEGRAAQAAPPPPAVQTP
ncbi:MAG: hypothetical protein AAB421_04120 [Patescibacteria group bacterium]